MGLDKLDFSNPEKAEVWTVGIVLQKEGCSIPRLLAMARLPRGYEEATDILYKSGIGRRKWDEALPKSCLTEIVVQSQEPLELRLRVLEPRLRRAFPFFSYVPVLEGVVDPGAAGCTAKAYVNCFGYVPVELDKRSRIGIAKEGPIDSSYKLGYAWALTPSGEKKIIIGPLVQELHRV